MRKVSIWIVIPASILMIGFWIWLAYDSHSLIQNFKDNGIKTSAQITHQESSTSGNKIFVDYEYTVDGQIYEATEKRVFDKSLGETLIEGQYVEIYYLPSNPLKTYIVNDTENISGYVYLGLLTLGISGIEIIRRPIPEEWRRKQIAKVIINARWLAVTSFVPFALAFVLYFEPLDERPMNTAALIVFGAGIVAAVSIFVFFAIHWVVIRQNIIAEVGRQYVDVSDQDLVMPQGKYNFEDQLLSLGFQKVGMTAQENPIEDETMVGWLFHNDDATIVVEVAYAGIEIMRFYSWFGDNFRVETSFPIGENLNTPQLVSRFTEESLADAYAIHLTNYQKYVAEYGRPHAIRTVEDALKWDHEQYMPNHFRRTVQRHQTTAHLRLIYGFFLLAFTVGLIPAYQSFSKAGLWAYVAVGMFFVFVLNMLPGWLLNRRRTPVQYPTVEAKELHKELGIG